MPRWLTTLITLALFFGFVLPNPAAAGQAVGNAVNSIVVFFKGIGSSFGYGSGAGTTGTGTVHVYPTGGVSSGDGTTDDGDGALLLGLGSMARAQPTRITRWSRRLRDRHAERAHELRMEY